MSASSQTAGGRPKATDRKEHNETRRDMRHSTAPHRHKRRANTGMSGVLDNIDKAGHAPSTDGARLHASIHCIHHTHHPARLNREAPPHPKPTLRPPEHAPWPRRSAIQGPKLRQSFDRQAIKSNQTQPVLLRQAGRQAHAHMQACKHSSSRRAHATAWRACVHTLHYLREATCSTSRVIH